MFKKNQKLAGLWLAGEVVNSYPEDIWIEGGRGFIGVPTSVLLDMNLSKFSLE